MECVSALVRLERDATLGQRTAVLAFDRLNQLASGWHEVDPSDIVRETPTRFLRVHPLRAAYALQLAAAFIAEQRPPSMEMLTLGDRLANAARKEAFAVVDIATA